MSVGDVLPRDVALPLSGPRERGRSLSAAGRASVSGLSPAAAGNGVRAAQKLYDEKHQAYLQALQERNQQRKLQEEIAEQQQADRVKREQGFNTCFSGANAGKNTLKEKSRLSAGYGGLRIGGTGEGRPRQWEDATVEIKGSGGEVYAIRPSGQRRAIDRPPLLGQRFAAAAIPEVSGSPKICKGLLGSSTLCTTNNGDATMPLKSDTCIIEEQDAKKDDENSMNLDQEVVPELEGDARASMPSNICELSATQQELQGLRAELMRAGLAQEDEIDHDAEGEPVGEKDGIDHDTEAEPVGENSVADVDVVENQSSTTSVARKLAASSSWPAPLAASTTPLSPHAVAPADECVLASPSRAVQEDQVAAPSSPRRKIDADAGFSPQLIGERIGLLSPEWQAALLALVEQAESGMDAPGCG